MTRAVPVLLAHVDSLRGGVRIDDAPAAEDAPLREDQTLRTSRQARAALRLPDGSRLVLSSETSVRLAVRPDEESPSAKALLAILDRGTMEASIERRDHDNPFLVETPTATARVLGTRFTVTATDASTRLNVREGRVSVTRRSDRDAVIVSSGQMAVVTGREPLTVRSAVPLRPILEVETDPAPHALDLTAEGTLDWIHWYWRETVQIVRRKGSPPELGSLRVFNATQIGACPTAPVRISWSNGKPTGSRPGAATGLRLSGSKNGLRITAAAGKEPRQLRIYTGVSSATLRLEASLSDQSARPVTDLSLLSESEEPRFGVYSLRYAAVRPGQNLVVRLTPVETAEKPEEEFPRRLGRERIRRGEPAIVLQAVTLAEAAPVDMLPDDGESE